MSRDDPLEGLRELSRARTKLESLLREQLAEARSQGATWEEIGESLGISRQSAWELYTRDVRERLDEAVAAGDLLSKERALRIAIEEVTQTRRRRQARPTLSRARSFNGANVIVTMTFMPDKWVLDRLYPVAEAQLGYFTTHQAEEIGVDRRYLTHHLRSGNLERVERGIYRLRHYPSHAFEDVMTATLWVGEGSAASHDTALAIYGLADAMPPVIHITVDRRFRGDRPGVVVHKARLPEKDMAIREGIPVTTPLRTLADVAMDRSVAEAAASEALDRGLVREAQLRDLAASRPELAGLIGSLLNR